MIVMIVSSFEDILSKYLPYRQGYTNIYSQDAIKIFIANKIDLEPMLLINQIYLINQILLQKELNYQKNML